MSLVEQLTDIYLNEENWHTRKLTEAQAKAYYEVALKKGRILYFQSTESDETKGNVLGYVETWRINFEQFGRILCGLPFDISQEDVQTGPICYVEGTWIHPDYRGVRSPVFHYLRLSVFRQNFQAEFFVGEPFRKKAGMLKILKRTDAIRKYLGE